MQFSSVRVRDFRSIADSNEIPLGPVTLFVGRNNSGKSALLHAIYRVQHGAPIDAGDTRLGADGSRIDLTLGSWADFSPQNDNRGIGRFEAGTVLSVMGPLQPYGSVFIDREGSQMPSKQTRLAVSLAPGNEPNNAIYPVLSTRRQQRYEEQVRRDAAVAVSPDDSNLVSRVMALATSEIAEALEFRKACKAVLGIQLNVLTNQHGQQHLGVQVDRFRDISLARMGAGVTSTLNLLLGLSSAHHKLFIIEEPENDLHPHALKALLDIIVEKSNDNQFVISTHSSVVLARLGSLGGAVVVHTRSDSAIPPTTTYRVVDSTAERMGILQDLGYELADLELGEGWLIFEESSAERIAREFLIPWFAPRLLRLRTLAASGTSRLGPIMQDFRELFLFAHLEPMYRGRAWVIADGDPSGVRAVEELRRSFRTWPSDRFVNFDSHNFEEYYPEVFKQEVADVLSILDKQERREGKKVLLNKVLAWIADDEEFARNQFIESAYEVVEKLRVIEDSLVSLGRMPASFQGAVTSGISG